MTRWPPEPARRRTIDLTLQQAAEVLGKSVRQVRYLVQHDHLPARKVGRVWRIRSDDLPLSDGQRAATGRRRADLAGAVGRALGSEPANQGRATRSDSDALAQHRDAIGAWLAEHRRLDLT